jgi:hypothetical protein
MQQESTGAGPVMQPPTSGIWHLGNALDDDASGTALGPGPVLANLLRELLQGSSDVAVP